MKSFTPRDGFGAYVATSIPVLDFSDCLPATPPESHFPRPLHETLSTRAAHGIYSNFIARFGGRQIKSISSLASSVQFASYFSHPSSMEESNLTMHVVPSRIINEARTNKAIISLHVSSEDDDGIYVATDMFSTVYGAGESTGQAIDDYVENLFEQLADLEHEEDHLGESLRSELAAIRRHLRRTA